MKGQQRPSGILGPAQGGPSVRLEKRRRGAAQEAIGETTWPTPAETRGRQNPIASHWCATVRHFVPLVGVSRQFVPLVRHFTQIYRKRTEVFDFC